jgi:phosphoserine phosphatase
MQRLLERLSRKLQHVYRTKIKHISAIKTSFTKNLSLSLTPTQPMRTGVTVVIPVLNEGKTINAVVQYALSDPATAEVIVIDDSSIDDTAELAKAAGAQVITSSMLGKGGSMQDGTLAANFDFVVFLDGDLSGLKEHIISDMIAPLLNDSADFVKAKFGRGGGRVTELTAKPMLKVFFPEIAHFSQPLGGIIAVKTTLLKQLQFEAGYGVDVGLLIDASRKGARIVEVDIGSLEHDSQPLLDLTLMANEVSKTIHNHAKQAGRLHIDQIFEMYEVQRQVTTSFDYIVTRQKNKDKVLLLSMDRVVTPACFVEELAKFTGIDSNNEESATDPQDPSAASIKNVVSHFKFTHRTQFEKVATTIALRDGIVDFVKAMKRQGFMVGVISDAYYVAADIIRKRIFADFAMAHSIKFQHDICTGEILINPDFFFDPNRPDNHPCKSHVVKRFMSNAHQPKFQKVCVIGSASNDLNMLLLADDSYALDPNTDAFVGHARIELIQSLGEVAQRYAE